MNANNQSTSDIQVPEQQVTKLHSGASTDLANDALSSMGSMLPQQQGAMPAMQVTQDEQQLSQIANSVLQQAEQPHETSTMQNSASSASLASADSVTTTLSNYSGVATLLLERKLLTEEQITRLQAESVTTGKKLEDLVIEQGLVDPETVAKTRADYFNVAYVKLSEVAISPESLNQIPEGVARRYQLFPFALNRDENQLSLAMANPLDLRAIDFIEKKTGYRVLPHLALAQDVHYAIENNYAQSLSTEVSAALKESESDKKIVDVKNLGEVIREAPIAKIVETILSFAMKSKASDVHIEPQEAKTRIRYRVDGILHEKLVLPKGVQDAVVSRIKILAELKIDEKRIPQDGRFSFRAGSEEVDLRVSTLPTVHGEKVVMRLLQKTQKVPALSELGLRGMALRNLETSLGVPHGIILVTGPTGSGKTTTLYSMIHQINSPKINIMTLEDPVEYEMHGVNQVQINKKAGLNFASGLRSFLRQDPDVIMVGEIRDQETASLAVQASLTGHLVFSTLHTNSAAGALPRLMDMEVESYLLASSVTCVVGQRVVRKICTHCKEEYKPEQSVVDDMQKVLHDLFPQWLRDHQLDEQSLLLHRGAGCSECNNTGYSGRVGIYEVLPITERVGKLILQRKPAMDIEKEATTNGMLFMKQDGYLKVLEGVTTVDEVLRVAEI